MVKGISTQKGVSRIIHMWMILEGHLQKKNHKKSALIVVFSRRAKFNHLV